MRRSTKPIPDTTASQAHAGLPVMGAVLSRLCVHHALDATARTIGICSQRVIGSLARTQTALAHADLAALRDGGEFDTTALSRVLQELCGPVQRLRGEA